MKYLFFVILFIPFASRSLASSHFSSQFLGDTLRLSVGNAIRICASSPDSLEITVNTLFPDSTINWTPNTHISIFDNGKKVKIKPSQSTLYIASVATPNGIFQDSVWVMVDSLPQQFSISPRDTLICQGNDATLRTTPISSLNFPDLKYQWVGNGRIGAGNTPTETFRPSENTTVFCRITNGACTSPLIDSASIRLIKVQIACDPDTMRIESGEPLTLTAQLSPANLDATNFTFQWSELANQVATGLTFQPQTSRNFEDSITVRFSLLAKGMGCELRDQKNIVFFNPLVVMPNAFTPNGDQKNDTFGWVKLRGRAELLSFQIYNRWGELIFESVENNARWDGKNINGLDMPTDTYIYVIQWRRADRALQKPLIGEVTLLR